MGDTNQSFEAVPHFLIFSGGSKVDPFPVWLTVWQVPWIRMDSNLMFRMFFILGWPYFFCTQSSIFRHIPTGWWWLEPWNFKWLSHHIGNVIIPTDFHSMIFQRGGWRKTTNQPLESSPLSVGRVQEVWLPAAEVAGRIPEGLGASLKLSLVALTGVFHSGCPMVSWTVGKDDKRCYGMPKIQTYNFVSCQAHTHTFRWKNRIE